LLGSLGVFMAADLASFFLAYALVSIPAYGLVTHDNSPRARRAGGIYMAFTVLGETLALMGFVLLATATLGHSLLIRDAMAALPGSPWRDATLALVIAGFGMKIALVPMHFWMPLTYRAAPIPAAAVLSGAAAKAGVIGLIRFLPLGATLPGWGGTLAALGLFTAFYGVAVGITQAHPKTVLAYSSISQMGLMAAVLGMGLAVGDAGAAVATAFYAVHHVLVKGALFLAVGVASAAGARRLWPVRLPAAVLALSLGGLPLTGGALAKLAVKAPLGDGVVSLLATLSAAGSTLLMLHFLRRLVTTARNEEVLAPARLVAPWLAIAVASVVVPWVLYPLTDSGSLANALAPYTLWAALWPMLVGGGLFLVLRRFGDRVPHVPEGDVLAAGDGIASAAVAWGKAFEQADAYLRQWPVASLSLLAVATLLGAAMLFAH
jgi:multicomponent Na+:H+ antiporter subunit A